MCTLFYNILCFYAFGIGVSFVIIWFLSHEKTNIRLLSAFLVGITWPISLPVALLFSLFNYNGQHFYTFESNKNT